MGFALWLFFCRNRLSRPAGNNGKRRAGKGIVGLPRCCEDVLGLPGFHTLMLLLNSAARIVLVTHPR